MQQPRIIRLPEVITLTGYKRSSIYLLMARGQFPKHHRIGLRAVGWNSQDIEHWINEQLEGESSAPQKTKNFGGSQT